MPEAPAKLSALLQAGVVTPPSCEGDESFIAERVDLVPADLKRMRFVCSRCDLFALCADYARAARPPAGFWAGTHRGKGAAK